MILRHLYTFFSIRPAIYKTISVVTCSQYESVLFLFSRGLSSENYISQKAMIFKNQYIKVAYILSNLTQPIYLMWNNTPKKNSN